MSWYYPSYLKIPENCFVCHQSLIGKDAVAHGGEEAKHPLHRECAKVEALKNTLCPHNGCGARIDENSIMTWKEKWDWTNIKRDVNSGLYFASQTVLGGMIGIIAVGVVSATRDLKLEGTTELVALVAGAILTTVLTVPLITSIPVSRKALGIEREQESAGAILTGIGAVSSAMSSSVQPAVLTALIIGGGTLIAGIAQRRFVRMS